MNILQVEIDSTNLKKDVLENLIKKGIGTIEMGTFMFNTRIINFQPENQDEVNILVFIGQRGHQYTHIMFYPESFSIISEQINTKNHDISTD